MREDAIIGMITDYDYTDIVTIRELYEYLVINTDCVYTIKQYCDMRYSTNLERFHYDPYTGLKIDWKEVRKMLENYEQHSQKI